MYNVCSLAQCWEPTPHPRCSAFSPGTPSMKCGHLPGLLQPEQIKHTARNTYSLQSLSEEIAGLLPASAPSRPESPGSGPHLPSPECGFLRVSSLWQEKSMPAAHCAVSCGEVSSVFLPPPTPASHPTPADSQLRLSPGPGTLPMQGAKLGPKVLGSCILPLLPSSLPSESILPLAPPDRPCELQPSGGWGDCSLCRCFLILPANQKTCISPNLSP